MSNRLRDALSPYLLQHAANPVDWREWDAVALDEARRRDCPILLSVGYAACHWCHVMARESFADEEIAALMNRNFVNIKVDREERPDIDRIYQLAHYLIARRSGGWPLTMFLSPTGEPFFGGTYFPPDARGGMAAFPDILRRVLDAWQNHRDKITEQNRAVLSMLARVDAPAAAFAAALDDAPISAAIAQLKGVYDADNGGVGDAPKFPHPVEFSFALRCGDKEIREMALESAAKMARRGLFDHLGGGFFRYCVDARWEIPHFEKMLYDNALLLGLCADSYVCCGDDRCAVFTAAAGGTADFLLREMQDPQGGFYSSLDADSEGEEGKFYVWTKEDISAALSPDESARAARMFNLESPPNFEGKYHLHQIAGDADARDAEIRAKLFAARSRRTRPGCDDKVLTSWNALTIIALARAGWVFNRPEWRAAARSAMDFIRREMWREQKLYAVWRGGERRHPAYLDDYAFLLEAAIALMRDQADADLCAFAGDLADALLAQFEDAPGGEARQADKEEIGESAQESEGGAADGADAGRRGGGFYFTAAAGERLIRRDKPADDNATPSGNGVAARALQRLGWLLGEPRYLDAAARALGFFYGAMKQSPLATTSLSTALAEHLEPPLIAVLSPAAASSAELAEWRAAAAGAALVVVLPDNRAGLPAAFAAKTPPAKGVCAYLCRGQTCRPPIADLGEFARAFGGGGAGADGVE